MEAKYWAQMDEWQKIEEVGEKYRAWKNHVEKFEVSKYQNRMMRIE
jgi:hypothetical protein